MAKKYAMKNMDIVMKELNKLNEAPNTVLNRTLSDVRKRAPGWISAEVAEVYGIKKKEVGDGKTSTLKIKGRKLPDVKLYYGGRLLTPTHFKMSPKTPKENRGGYTLKASILKDKRATLGKIKKLSKKQRAAMAKNLSREGARKSDHSPIMLMPAKKGSSTYIPFQRVSKNRKDVQAIKALSVPQMISSERVSPNIQKAIDENLGKRLDHHMKRHLGK